MSKQVQFRRGTYAENDAFLGAEGEITVDTDNNTLRVHNGVTQGGFPITGSVHFSNNEIKLDENPLYITVGATDSTLAIDGYSDEVHLHADQGTHGIRLSNAGQTAYIKMYPDSDAKVEVSSLFFDVYSILRLFRSGSGIVFSDSSTQITGLQNNTPATSVGADGDIAGMFAYDNNYIYVCVADYDGTTKIWKRTSTGAVW